MHLRPWMSVASAVLGFFVILAWRIREGQTPVTLRKILIPPAGMATGFCMFLAPPFRVRPLYALVAFLLGALILAWPLIRTSHLRLQPDGVVTMHRSPSFFIVLVVLALIRILAHSYLDTLMTVPQTGGLFFILAFGMILHWRTQMYFEYKRVTAAPS
jgi:membrane protein CcdC involved in cytochrome C biogenesis